MLYELRTRYLTAMRFRRRRNREWERVHQQVARQCAYFFIPLPQPLNIEDGAMCRLADDIDPDSLYDPDSPSLGIFYNEFGHMMDTSVSLRFHQVISAVRNVQFSAAMEAANNAFPPIGSIGNNDDGLDDVPSTTTVVEAVVPIANEDEESLSPAFDRAIECIRQIQLGYAKVSGEPITQISRLQVPFAVPLAIREYQFGEDKPVWPTPEQLQIFLTNVHDSYLKGKIITDQSTPHDLDQVMHATRVTHEGPFASAHQLIEKATSFADYDNTVGSVLLGAAAEMLLLDLAVSLLWEKGLDPRDTSKQVLTKQSHTRSVKQILYGPVREALGEAWSFVGDERVAVFLTKVMKLRNRTVHQGVEPSDDQIRSAFQANSEFFVQVERALVEQLELYPVTAATLVAPEKFESLGKLTALEDALDETPRPLDNWQAYGIYRFEVMRPTSEIGLDDDGELCGCLNTCHLALLLHPRGRERWWLVDEEASVVCAAHAPPLTRKQRTFIRRARRARPKFGIESSGGFAIRVDGVQSTPRNDPPQWHRMGDVWPMRRWDRYPAWPLPYPLVLKD